MYKVGMNADKALEELSIWILIAISLTLTINAWCVLICIPGIAYELRSKIIVDENKFTAPRALTFSSKTFNFCDVGSVEEKKDISKNEYIVVLDRNGKKICQFTKEYENADRFLEDLKKHILE